MAPTANPTIRTARRLTLAVLLSLATAPLIAQVQAQTAKWPEKPIRLVVGFAPGGFTDVLARLIGQKLSERLGQPVIVENKAGAAGTLGADLVAKAVPDGYTLLLGHSNSNAVAPALYPRLPYQVLRDFTPIIRVATTPLLLTINPNVAAKDVASFVALAKSKPDGLSFASSGSGSSQHLAAARFMLATQTQMTHVPYKGSGQAIVDLLSGNVDLNFESPPNVLPHLKAGKLRALAITSAKRSPLLPQVQTLEEGGIKDANVYSWQAFAAPRGLPADVKAKLHAAIVAGLNDAQVKPKLLDLGFEIVANTPEQFAAYQAAEFARWKKLIADRNIKAD